MNTTRNGGVVASIALLFTTACASMGGGGSQTALMKAEGSQATALEYRAAANNLAIRIPGLIERTGDRVLAQTLDPELRRRALLWKLDGISAFQQALFRPDPLGAAIETWTLAIQLEDAVDTGVLKDAYGSLQPLVQEGAAEIRRAMDEESKSIARRPDAYQRAREFVTKWAHEHPISLPFSARPSIQPLLARLASGEELGVIEEFGSVTATVADLSTKLDIYAAYLPKTVRWQAELVALEVARTDTGRLALATLQSAHGVLGRADTLLSRDGVKDLSSAAVSSLRGERVALLGDIERQRMDSFDRLGQERQAVLGNVDGQRRATLTDLDAKLARGLEGAEGLRARAMADLEGIVTRTLLRVAVAAGALMTLASFLVWMVLRSGVLRRPPPVAT